MWTCGFYRYEHVYILTEGRNFKTFLKENFAIPLEHRIEYDIDNAYRICIH